MTDKKNYCVDGKCTAICGDKNLCKYSNLRFLPLPIGLICRNEVGSQCWDKSANAEWRKTNGTDN